MEKTGRFPKLSKADQNTIAMLKLLAQSQKSLEKGEKTYSNAEVRRRVRAALQRYREQ